MTPQPASAVQRAPSTEFHNLCNAAQLTPRMQVVYERIARRACELAQALAQKERYTQEDWAQAESEWLRPVPVEIETYADKITVRAAVLGFDEHELQVAIEPARIIIAGKKENQPAEGNRLFYIDWYPDEILQVVNLPEEIDPKLAIVKLCDGILVFDFLKALEWPQWALGVMDG